jgi:hypothetical protein
MIPPYLLINSIKATPPRAIHAHTGTLDNENGVTVGGATV